jgi:heavy metal translocating P-type ATPase
MLSLGRVLRTLLITRRDLTIAGLAVAGIAAHLLLRHATGSPAPWPDVPLFVVLAIGGLPLVWDITRELMARDLGADILAAISIVAAVVLGEHLAGALVVLMLSGGKALEGFAVGRASSVLQALARRMPSVAHRRVDGRMADVPLDAVAIDDALVVFPHEICPVDGNVLEGHSVMDESYLTGEPFLIPKAPGSSVLSGAINGEGALVIRAQRQARDSRYASIMRVMQEAEQKRPRLRRLADRIGAVYAPLALAIAIAAWVGSGDPVRFLAVLVIATPCPLLIAIPVSILGAVSLAAERSIIVRNPAVLEQIEECSTVIFDKTGTLTYGRPEMTERIAAPGADADDALRLAASLERYSKHPLAPAVLAAAEQANLFIEEASEVHERPGEGLTGIAGGRRVTVTGRRSLERLDPSGASALPPPATGLECAVLVDGRYAALFRFRDRPRAESRSFVRHLGPKHGFTRVLLVSGDREAEVRYLAERVGIEEVHAGQTPEQKVEITRAETARAKTLFVGDGINDAPALMTATVGLAFGANSDVTAEAAGAVIMDSSIEKVDEFFHIGRRFRSIALQSAIGGIALSVVGMGFAAFGYLPPVAGAICQELIDLAAILNALRVALWPGRLSDYQGHE